MVKVKLYRIKNSDRKFSLSTNILRYLWFKFNLSEFFFLTYSFVKIFRGFILGTFCLVQQIFNTREHKTYRVLNFLICWKKLYLPIYTFLNLRLYLNQPLSLIGLLLIPENWSRSILLSPWFLHKADHYHTSYRLFELIHLNNKIKIQKILFCK